MKLSTDNKVFHVTKSSGVTRRVQEGINEKKTQNEPKSFLTQF